MYRSALLLFLISVLLSAASCCLNRKAVFDAPVISKSDWNGKPGNSEVMKEHSIRAITIHHEGVFDNGKKTGAEKMRNLQLYSQEQKNWGDVPYHYVIDLTGKVYAGREVGYAGDTNTEYDPTGHLLICVHGNYEDQPVPEAAYRALVKFTATQALLYQVPVAQIKTHKDYVPGTLCPGKNLYHYFETGQFHRDVLAEIKREQK